jgi:hypothetical protein
MVTKQELDNILQQVNAILKSYDERIKALEEQSNKPKTQQKRAPIAQAS